MRQKRALEIVRSMRSQIYTVACWIPVIIALGGCSSAIALTQYAETTKPRSIEVGEHRAIVERRLGESVRSETHADGTTTRTYQYKLYRQTKFWGSPGQRAIQYLEGARAFFLTEVILVPLEIAGKIYRTATRDTVFVHVRYGADETVINTKSGMDEYPPRSGTETAVDLR